MSTMWTVLGCPGYLKTLGHGTSVDVHYVDCPRMSWVSRTLGHGTSVDVHYVDCPRMSWVSWTWDVEVHYVGHPWTVLGCPGYLRTLRHGTGLSWVS